MTHEHEPGTHLEYGVWLVLSICSAIFLIPHIVILVFEIQKRRRDRSESSNPSKKYGLLQFWSTLTIIAGLVYCASNCLRYLWGSCYIMWYLSHASIRLQPVFLGNVQLSRLYYCFAARPEGAGPNGYPQWVFLVMYAISGFCVILVTIPYGFQIPQSCFIDENYTFRAEYYPFSVKKSWTLTIRSYFEMSLYMSWDMAILLLFCFSVRSIARTQILLHQPSHSEDVPNSSNNDGSTVSKDKVSVQMAAGDDTVSGFESTLSPVFRTLYRVLTVTLFYEIVCILIFSVNNVVIPRYPPAEALHSWLTIGELLLISTWTLSAYLMLDHNRWAYFHFIRGLYALKLHYCCCCYHYIVPWQLKDHQKHTNDKVVYTVDLKAEAPGIPENDSYQTCTDTAEVERNRMKSQQEMNHMREERARQRVQTTQKEGQ